jgi:hypothetical protein
VVECARVSSPMIPKKLDFMERETGVEPATSSLGNYHSFVNKRLMRLRRRFLVM